MTRPSSERGVALIASLLVMAMMSAMLAGLMVMVNADQMAGGIERDQTQAYAAAHAGVEKLTADLGQLFATNFNPTGAQLGVLAGDDRQPDIPGVQYLRPDDTSGYRITFNDTNPADGNPDVADPGGTPIGAGPFQGLVGLITPYTVEVTARTAGDAEVRMRRTMQTVAIPVFQFGIFSESNLSFHAGDNFSFGGRVHSNNSVYLAAASGATVTLADRVTAVQEIVRQYFTNGRGTNAAGYTGTVRMAKAPGCPSAPTAANGSCRNLAMNEGSVTGDVGSAKTAGWASISVGAYNSYLRNGDTGARRLDLPLVSDGAEPIDIIRRPPTVRVGGVLQQVVESPQLSSQRFYNLASLRILLSDTEEELLVRCTGVTAPCQPVSLEQLQLPVAAGGWNLARANDDAANRNMGTRFVNNTPLLGGWILITRQSVGGAQIDVTREILALGITGRNIGGGTAAAAPPNAPALGAGCTLLQQHQDAVIRIQRLKDTNTCAFTAATSGDNFWPMTLYDPREGLRRDNAATGDTLVRLGGVMHYIEFDVGNFKRWIEGGIGVNGPGSMNVTGYVVYFSDRRGNKDNSVVPPAETAEFGYEDIVNPDVNGTPNGGLPGPGEDFNANGTLQTYGGTLSTGGWAFSAAGTGGLYGTGTGAALTAAATLTTTVNPGVARANRAVFFRRALKIVNGGLGNMPSVGLQGLTIASENPVYVEGNFNACGNALTGNCASNGFGPTNDAHRSAAVIADSVTLLSRNWNDHRSYRTPHNAAGNNRDAMTTWYRMAVISGKGLSFNHPGNGEFANFGSDGGAHNFLRFVENWSSSSFNPIIYYRGSMVSLYTARQATGTWKCCVNIYTPPDRGASFDVEFLSPALLPPRTPMFRDINTLTFRQIMRPTQ
ncbi:MAG: hypothetical protein IT178_17260 [Acidobacteria bacterium]|nr:hypothetical protein [Acidobacteriota bacterium]